MFSPKTETEKQKALDVARFRKNLPLIVRWNVLSGCCGFHEIRGWESVPTADLKKFQAEAVEYLSRETNFYEHPNDAPAVLLTTIAQYQVQVMTPIFSASGFELISRGLNKKTSNAVFLWAKVLNETKKTGLV